MSEKSLKVTDRRMFTPEGELREEFIDLPDEPPSEDRSRAGASPPESSPRPASPEPEARRAPEPTPSPETGPGRSEGPSFFDLVGLLAEPASIYLQEARGAPPQTAAQSLELARLHIELLAVLEDKTRGNLTAEEKAMLADVVYQLRSGFVGLGG